MTPFDESCILCGREKTHQHIDTKLFMCDRCCRNIMELPDPKWVTDWVENIIIPHIVKLKQRK